MTTADYQKLNVAILCGDINQAKKLSDTLRDFGIFSHFHSELNEFWVAIATQKPDLCIVDVTKMSQGTLVFKNHPRVVKNELNYAFLYSEADKFLLNSTNQLPHLGVIRSEITLKGQVETILNRVMREIENGKRENFLQARIQRLQKRSARLVADINQSVQFHEKLNSLNELVEYAKTNSQKYDFNSVLCQMFCDWQGVQNFGLYELNKSGQKLSAHIFNRKKYHQLPQLWLGQTCQTGIEGFAQDMAVQVAIDVIAGNIRTINIRGEFENPDIMVLFEANEEITEAFNWNLLEDLLSGIYRKTLLKNSRQIANSRVLSSWESLSLQDDIYYNQKTSDVKLLNISFSKLVGQIKTHYNNRFYWKAFYQDFIHQLDAQLSAGAYFSEYGVHELLIFCEKENYEKDLLNVKTFIKTFSYWRYFADTSLVLASDSTPVVQLINASSINYLRMIDRDMDDLESAINIATKRASEILSPTSM